MATKDLTQHMLYYQRIVQTEPSNIEAGLRLAAIYREGGFVGQAIQMYAQVARLLANQGLPLEAIAACKAILELDATHTETQFFLARLYAQAPESAGMIARQLPQAKASSSIHRQGMVQGRTIALRPGAVRCEVSRSAVSSDEVGKVDPELLRETAEDLQGIYEIDEGDYEEATTKPLAARLVSQFAYEALADEDFDAYEDLSDALEVLSWGDVSERNGAGRGVDAGKLPEIPLFGQLDSAAFFKLLAVTEHRKVRAGEVILKPDDVRTSLFVVIRGTARVEKDLLNGRRVRLAELGVGEFFGEFRLLTGHDGMARVVAATDMELLEIRDEALYELAPTHPQVWDALWNLYYSRMLNNLLASSVIFERLSQAERDELAACFVLEEFLADELLLKQGWPCDGVYLIVSGEAWVEKRTSRGGLRRVDVLVGGDFVGVTPCATGSVSSVRVRATLDTVVLKLSAEDFRKCLREHEEVAQAVDFVVRERRRRLGNDAEVRAYQASAD